MSKKYKLDRKRFILFYSHKVRVLTKEKMILDDLIKGSEFIITAQDVLDSMNTIDGCLVNCPGERIRTEDCELVYI